MGEKDITEKILEDHNDVFADIINGLIFAGEQRILPESLENTAVHSQYKADDEKVHELERDVTKYWKDQDVQLAICGIENQSSVEKYMPFRIIGYDGTAYRSQLQDKRKEILPVMTIVLYFGTEHRWYGKRNIKGLMKIPEGLDDYINDYKMQVFEVAWLTEEQISRFRSDFKIVANFFVQKRKNKDYIPDDPTEIKHIDEVLKLLQVMTGDEHYKEVIRKKKGVRSMCDVAERLEKMGIAKGIEIGKSEGIIEGKMQVYKNLLERGFSEKEAKEITEIVLIQDRSAEELKSIIAQCCFFVGARTHATIAAYSSCVPTLVVGYSVKARGIARDIFGTEEEYVIAVQSMKDTFALKRAFEKLWGKKNEIREYLNRTMPQYCEEVLKAKKILETVCESERK